MLRELREGREKETERERQRERERKGEKERERKGEKERERERNFMIIKLFQKLAFTIHFFAYLRPFLLHSNAIRV